jgi:hypothetical protein
VPGTRQSKAIGKGGRRDRLHLPSSFAECRAVRHSTKHFLFFFKFLCRVPPNLAPGKDFFYFLKNFFARGHTGTGKLFIFFVFFSYFFVGPCYSK